MQDALFFLGFGFVFGLLFFEAGFILADKGTQLRIVVFLAVERIIQRTFRVLFRHGVDSL